MQMIIEMLMKGVVAMQNSRWNLWFTVVMMLSWFIQFTLFTKSACIIVHGTWGAQEAWHARNGDFFQAVMGTARKLRVVDEVRSFVWDGKLGYLSQYQAAKKLVTVIEQYDQVILVCHSHGATVGIIASRLIGEKYSSCNNLAKIKKFYALGVPVDLSGEIYPDMSAIDRFYNIFSFGDVVQPVQAIFGRCFAPCERLINVCVMLNDIHPSHAQLHCACIGRWLLAIEEFLMQHKVGNFENFSFDVAALISFFDDAYPQFQIQHDRQHLLELDHKVQLGLLALLLQDRSSLQHWH